MACLLTMMKPDLFVGLVLSAPAVEVDPKLAGTCMVSSWVPTHVRRLGPKAF